MLRVCDKHSRDTQTVPRSEAQGTDGTRFAVCLPPLPARQPRGRGREGRAAPSGPTSPRSYHQPCSRCPGPCLVAADAERGWGATRSPQRVPGVGDAAALRPQTQRGGERSLAAAAVRSQSKLVSSYESLTRVQPVRLINTSVMLVRQWTGFCSDKAMLNLTEI